MSRSYRSNWETVGSTADPDILYYNASIVNNNTDDQISGYAFQDPPVKFNETRDTPIIRDASQYQFSIIRFVVNGPNKDLPLFIPSVQSGTGQGDPNLTEYAFGLSATIPVELTAGGTSSINLQTLKYVIYEPEIVNPTLAPVPPAPCSPDWVGPWVVTDEYKKGQIVTLTIINAQSGLTYDTFYQAQRPVPALTDIRATFTDPITGITSPYWVQVGSELGRPQDLSTRYYWVFTFQHWVNLLQNTLESANLILFNQYTDAVAEYSFTNEYPTYADWIQINATPIVSYDIPSKLFSIAFPDNYASPLTGYTNALWMNQNMEGLLSNFLTTYYNVPTGNGTQTGGLNPQVFPPGFSYEVKVQYVGLGTNWVEAKTILPPNTYTGDNFIIMTQEVISTSTLWCPVESVVFVSNLLPIQNEATAPPNTYGVGNIGNSSATAPSAFQPIITDIANDLANDPFGWRKMIYYAPVAEYRMADFQNSKAEIKNIDIQVFWKNRLNNQLYPLLMTNLSSVSIKIIFRKKQNLSKTERVALY